MERSEWLKAKRRTGEERMDTLWAPIYDENWGGTIEASHQSCIHKFLALCPKGCTILDAACGTGKYWSLILESGRKVVGIDQSQGMLDRAKAKFPQIPAQKLGLQEISDENTFDAIICMDALELVPPEEWSPILGNFHRALKAGGLLYFTVELAQPEATQAAFEAGQAKGLPVVYGEWGHEAGYHYYPAIDQVRRWISEAQFTILEEAIGDDYHHFITRRS
jgi:ubiquinone/menaquinone biosynthesis C-methylase UbiE